MVSYKQKSKKRQHLEDLKHAARVARNTLFIVLGLTIIKAFAGYITNIISLTGDAVGSFSDIIAASAIFVGLKLSQKKASSKFKYGYHRVETLISLLISASIIFAGYKIFEESIKRAFITTQTTAHNFGIAATIISIIASIFAFYYQNSVARKINSSALRTSASDKFNDSIVSTGVLASVIADKMHIQFVDMAVGVVISILIVWTGLKTGKDALFYLLDYWNDPKVTAQIKQILKKSKIVTAVKNIRLRHAGTYIFGEAFLEINPFTDSKDLRDEIHRLNREVEKNVEHLGDLVLYIDPPKPMRVKAAIPIEKDNGLKSNIAENPDRPFRFFFVEIRNEGLRKFYSRQEEFVIGEPTKIADFLRKERANILISSMLQPLLYYNLRLNNIKVYPHFLDVKDVENTVKLLLLDI